VSLISLFLKQDILTENFKSDLINFHPMQSPQCLQWRCMQRADTVGNKRMNAPGCEMRATECWSSAFRKTKDVKQAVWGMHWGGTSTESKPVWLPISISSSVFAKSLPLVFTFYFNGIVPCSWDFKPDVMNCTCPNGEARTTETRVGPMP